MQRTRKGPPDLQKAQVLLAKNPPHRRGAGFWWLLGRHVCGSVTVQPAAKTSAARRLGKPQWAVLGSIFCRGNLRAEPVLGSEPRVSVSYLLLF